MCLTVLQCCCAGFPQASLPHHYRPPLWYPLSQTFTDTRFVPYQQVTKFCKHNEKQRKQFTGVALQEQRSQGAKPDASASAEHGSSYEESEQDLLCVCQQPYNVDTAMVSCDMCEDWYHLRCVGVTQTAAKSMKKYVCPVCTALKGNAEPLEAALAKVPCSHAVSCCLKTKTTRPLLLFADTPFASTSSSDCLDGVQWYKCRLFDSLWRVLTTLVLP